VDLTAQCPADVIITTPTTACTGVYTAPENPEPEGCTSGYTTTIKDDLDWPVGEHQSVLLLEDEWGATASCEVVLKVIDTTAPQLEIEKGPATSDTITWNIVTSDACGATWNVEADCGPVCKLAPTDDQLTISALPDSTPVTITVTSTDPSGNTIVEVATAMTAPLPYEETEINGTDESDGTAVVASTPKGAPGCVMYVPTSETPYVVLLLLAGLALLQKRRPVA
ncbi:MAG: hypothetical protein VX223_05500, partial [Myxococcota bacterium]|nr:hypothetical protein [Myxococcota bacterium]